MEATQKISGKAGLASAFDYLVSLVGMALLGGGLGVVLGGASTAAEAIYPPWTKPWLGVCFALGALVFIKKKDNIKDKKPLALAYVSVAALLFFGPLVCETLFYDEFHKGEFLNQGKWLVLLLGAWSALCPLALVGQAKNRMRLVMPYKHQAHCYRTIGGVQYKLQCDMLDEEHFKLVEKAKRLKVRHRVVKHQDGFGQLFVHPDDTARLCEA